MSVMQYPNLAADILNEIDEHLAWQADADVHFSEQSLEHYQASASTLMVCNSNSSVTSPGELETRPEVVQASIKPRRRVSSYVARDGSLHFTQYVFPPAPLLTRDKGKGKQCADAVHAQDGTFSVCVRPLRMQRAVKQHERAPGNYKSSHMAAPGRHAVAFERSSYDDSDRAVQREYTAIPAGQHVTHIAPPTPGVQPAKVNKVVSFVKALLGKLEATGFMGEFRRQRAEARRSRMWVDDGYVT